MTHQELASTTPAPSLRGEKVLLLPPDIESSELTTWGLARPVAHWNVQALQNVEKALDRYFGDHAAELIHYREDGLPSAQVGTLRSSVALSEAVGLSILGFRFLPTKAGRFDWTLGPDTVAPLREEFGANYALFVYLRDSHASAGRIGLSMGSALGGRSMPLGQQTGFALLADLRTGQVVWFNQLVIGSLTSDLRDPDSAESSIEALMRGYPA